MAKLARLIWPVTTQGFRFRVLVLTVFSLFVSFLDAAALYLFARVFSSIAQMNHEFVYQSLSIVGLRDEVESITTGYAVIISAILLLFFAKSFCTLLISRKILTLLSKHYAKLTDKYIQAYYQMQINRVKSRPNFEIFMALNTGIKDIFVIGVFSFISLFVEVVVVAILLVFVLLNGGFSVILLMIFFVVVFLATNRFVSQSTQNNAEKSTKANLSGAIAIQTLTESIREIKLFGSLDNFVGNHRKAVEDAAQATVALQTTSLIPKLVLETSFMFGIAMFTLWNIVFGELTEAVVSVTFVVALGSRIVPSLLRLQTSYNSLKQVIGSSTFSTTLLGDPSFIHAVEMSLRKDSPVHNCEKFSPSISFTNVSYRYSIGEPQAVTNVSFRIEEKQSLGVVGYAGSGKSTLGDLMLGFIEPNAGEVNISDIPASKAVICCGSRIAYVPQNISLIDGTLRQNILLGRKESSFHDNDFDRALTFAGLSNYVKALNRGLDHEITRAGAELSGGQRQKIGIARAMLAAPEILVLDEPTSSLDSDSENEVNRAIGGLLGKVTLVVISHRLTTIKQLNRIAVMDDGKLVAIDTFEKLANENSIFTNFVKLSRL
jgi:ABC-type bacteriocin/lantibiotic exporter with double-glycine peptidase domain